MSRYSVRLWRIAAVLLLVFVGRGEATESSAQSDQEVSLVVVLIVDQLRADMTGDFMDQFGPGGFRRFYEDGVVYPDAVMRSAPTSTGPGHATLATGALPAVHGVIGNQWWDVSRKSPVNCVADTRHRIIGQSASSARGVSPRYLAAETFADVIHDASGGESRTISLSVKDRSAVLPAGHSGKAVWYSKWTGQFVTSDYYYSSLPGWASEFNATRMGQLEAHVWNLSRARPNYRFKGQDDQPWELLGLGGAREFPHRLADSSHQSSALRFMPLADRLLVELAKSAVTELGLGEGPAVDVLILGLSASDYIGHAYGPDSLEWEDNLLQLDQLLAEMFDWLERDIGMQRVMVGLSSDHGVASAPEYLLSKGQSGGRVDTPGMEKDLRAFLRDRFKLRDDPVLGASYPAIYLDAAVLSAAGLDLAEVEAVAAERIQKTEGIASVLTRSDILARRIRSTPVNDRVMAGFHAERSGHLFLIQEQGWFMEEDPHYYAATHGSPYDHDVSVPVMFLAPGLKAQVVRREIGTEDFAPSITRFLGLPAPRQATGVALAEIRRTKQRESYNPTDRTDQDSPRSD
ncbi:MAG: alkaline phosphatase family protein [Gammaproteobacteria bacterium]|nr:MAG: alkaline phosphatase family protein [Gammaproteobacteria bacterium]